MRGILVSVMSAAVLLTGCSGLHYFDLNLEPEPAKPMISGIIRVEDSRSNEMYWTRQMVFRKEPFKVEHLSYSCWAENPGDLIRNAVILFYRNSDTFTRVIDDQSSVEPDITLKIALYAVEMVKDMDGWYARLALDLEFFDPRTEQAVAVHTFDRKERISGKKPEYLARMVSVILKEELLRAAAKAAPLIGQTPSG